MSTLVHLSDLHLTTDPDLEREASALCRQLLATRAGHVVVTGDITHRGRTEELEAFERAFAPLAERGLLTVVPGNHDRMTDDAGPRLMRGPRVQAQEHDSLFLVRLDSTGPHNASLALGHGKVSDADLADLDRALDEAPRGALVCVLLHHHLLPLPADDMGDRLLSWLRTRWSSELGNGRQILELVRGRCDLVLHGHRHVAAGAQPFSGTPRPLGVYNAGATLRLGEYRVFHHAGGRLVAAPRWVPSWSGQPAAYFDPRRRIAPAW